MRVLLVGDGTGTPPQLEGDPLAATLAALPGLEVEDVLLVDPPTDGPGGGVDRLRLTADEVAHRGSDVWVTGSTSALAALGRRARSLGVRLVHRARRICGDATVDPAALHLALGLADDVVVPGLDAADWLRTTLGAASPRIHVIPPWLPARDRPGADGADRVVTVCGPLVGERRPMNALRAFGRLAGAAPDWSLRLLGAGPQRADLTRQAAYDGLRPRVTFSGPGPDLGAEWAASGVAVLAARTEPWPIDLLGAMSAGVPVIAYDVPGALRDLVRHGDNGLLVAPGVLADLATALARLTTDERLRADLREGALATAAAHAEHHGEPQGARLWSELLHGQPSAPLPALPPPPARSPVVLPGPAPAEARAAALRALTGAGATAGTPWFVLPGPTPTVVVPTADGGEVLSALAGAATAGEVPAYLSLRVPEHAGRSERRLPLAAAEEALVGLAPSLYVEPWPTSAEGRPLVAGQDCGVELRLWPTGLDGFLVAPPGAPIDAVRPPATTVDRAVAGVVVPVLAEAAEPVVEAVGFDVDAVVTWVDGADPAWEASREARLRAAGRQPETSTGQARFTDHGELRYALRSLWHFAPWVRRVHLVTAGQRPPWLDTTHERIRLVDHAEILPSDALPTFSSRAIETRLHHVPDLAEHFVYLNDDVLLARPHQPTRFFTPGGLPSVFVSPNPIGTPGPDRPAYLAAAANNRRLLLEAFGVRITHTLAHTPHPHRRSLLQEVEERYAADVAATTRSPFRSDTDVSMLSSLAQHHALLTGRAVAAEPDLTFVGLGAADLPRQLTAALRRDHDVVCLADDHRYALERARVDELVADFLERLLPHPAPWETDRPL